MAFSSKQQRNFRGNHTHPSGKSKMQLLCFTTTSEDFDAKKLSEEHVAENFDVIHNMGKKDSKYMALQVRRAPAMDRNHTESFRPFDPRSMEEHSTNRSLAATFQPFHQRRPPHLREGIATEYSGRFLDVGPDDFGLANLPKIPHKGGDHCKSVLHMSRGSLVTRSHSQTLHVDTKGRVSDMRVSDMLMPASRLESGSMYLAGPDGLQSQYSATHSGSFWRPERRSWQHS
eukprot:CAMPEP_0178390600 /NCGR_PEP_ID=MMETSP0689_2-20121128/10730_1 /TAXON_ID=160604 /ORGANISM="Amphidinium massartii, Strain CS-259" /LENGTH=229 /DNA_ID=CAMNT_0020011115 /DNA_START=33 /DNA_END=719 /DNA_ORIENTATION=-